MGKMELEIKILNIKPTELIEKIESLGGKFVSQNNQYLYTYDLPTIYGRFVDILTLLNNPESEIKKETAIYRLKLLVFELENLLTEEQTIEWQDLIRSHNIEELLLKEDWLEILNQQTLIEFLKKFRNNSKKWIRLRQTKDKTTLAVKHILKANDTSLQQMLETEIEVPSMKAGNDLLEALGFSYKSYQEKRRVTYILDDHEIDIDTWPGIPTYAEIEGKDEEDLSKIVEKLGYKMSDTISCTADEVYQMNGKTMFEKRELKFEDTKY